MVSTPQDPIDPVGGSTEGSLGDPLELRIRPIMGFPAMLVPSLVSKVNSDTRKPELHEVPGHLCNSGPQKTPKTTPQEPLREQHPRNPKTGKIILILFVIFDIF